jgi:hypothetical protein
MRNSGRSDLLEKVFSGTMPLRGRMIHGITASGELYEQPQDYDIHGRVSHLMLNLYNNTDTLIDQFRDQSWGTEQGASRRTRIHAKREILLQS